MFIKIRIFAFVFALVVLFYVPSVSAQAPKDNFVHFIEKDGLSGSLVYAVLQDRFGYIWLGTNNGLVRYDGYNFKNYYQDVEDPKSIQVAIIYALYEDRKDNLWIGGVQGFSKYNRETDSFTSYSISPFQPDYTNLDNAYISVKTFTEDNKDHLLLGIGPDQNGGNNRNGFLYLDKTTQQVKKYQLADKDTTNSIITSLISSSGDYWFGGHSGLIYLDNESRRIKFHRPDGLKGEFDFIVTSIAEDNNGGFWIGTSGQGFYHFNPNQSSFKKVPVTEKNIFDIFIDSENRLWLASGSGLILYNPQSGDSFAYTPDKNNPLSINSSSFSCITQDFAGSLWIGSIDGLNRLDKVSTHFTTFVNDPNDKFSFGPGWASYFSEDLYNDILIGLGQGSRFANLFDRKRNIFQRIPFADSAEVSIMFKDKHGKVWVGIYGENYLYNLNKDRKSFIKAPGFPRIKGVGAVELCFYESNDDSLWFGTINGFLLFEKARHELSYFLLDTLNNQADNFVRLITGDKDGNLWLATNDGLFKFDTQTEKSSRIGFSEDSSKSFLDQDITSIYIDKNGIVWSGSWKGGLNRYDPYTDAIKIYTRQDGLPSNSVQGILGDEESGSLWLSTYGGGLSRFDIKNEKFHNYDVNDGLHSNLFAINAVLKTSRGEFLFGGANGFTMFKPAEIRESNVAPKVFLTNFRLSNETVLPNTAGPLTKPIYDTKKIVLSYDQNDIAIEYMAIHFVKASETQYAFMLENYEDDWRNVGSQRSAIYPNLPPGEYVFRIKAANYNDVWNEEGAQICIIINPPLWATWWAYTLYILFGLGLLFSIRRFELKRRLLQAENKRKSEELEEARQLQLSMLPKELPQLPHLDIAVYMQTATEVGGDYYDFHVGLDGTLTVVIGDATGHGMKAGTMVTSVKSLFSTHAANPDMMFAFNEFSRCIRRMNFGRVSMCLTMLKITNHALQISTAGMPPAYIYRSKTKNVEEYQFEAMPLGAMKEFHYKIKDTKLSTGDTILLLSDGLPELENKSSTMFGYRRIKEGFQQIAEKSAEDIISYFKNIGLVWIDDGAPNDDVTFVVIKAR